MIACIITRSGLITLERGTFVLCDTGMNVVFIYFLSHSNHYVSWNLYFANSLFWIITFLWQTQSGGKNEHVTHRKTFFQTA